MTCHLDRYQSGCSRVSVRSQVQMQKENNCGCVVCQVERSLLNSLSTQTARTHFQALARNHSILNHFDSPADVIAQLHEHERTEAVYHKASNGILHRSEERRVGKE